MNKLIKINHTICGPDFDLFRGDQCEFVKYTELCDSVKELNAEGNNYKMCIVKITKCDSEPELIGVEGEFMIDENGELVSYKN